MTWLLENTQLVFTIITVVVVGVGWLCVRYRGQRARLQRDLEKLLHDGLDYLQRWAGDHLDEVTRVDVDRAADLLYDRYVAGTALARLVSRVAFRSALWGAFCEWRKRFAEVRVAILDLS